MGSNREADILAVDRGTQASAHHQANDRLLMNQVCAQLERTGFSILRIDEDDLHSLSSDLIPDRIISMAQAPSNTAHLGTLESQGRVMVNSFTSILHTYRSFLTIAMAKRPQLPFARGAVLTSIAPDEVEDRVETLHARFSQHLGSDFWLKRGDVHAAHENDVLQPGSETAFALALRELYDRGVETAVVQQHIPGDVYKFYGVAEQKFFHLQSFETGQPAPDDGGVLESMAMHTANYLDLSIFGGDAVRTESGWIMIDINAWPSFSTVRDQATIPIVEEIVERFNRGGDS